MGDAESEPEYGDAAPPATAIVLLAVRVGLLGAEPGVEARFSLLRATPWPLPATAAPSLVQTPAEVSAGRGEMNTEDDPSQAPCVLPPPLDDGRPPALAACGGGRDGVIDLGVVGGDGVMPPARLWSFDTRKRRGDLPPTAPAPELSLIHI